MAHGTARPSIPPITPKDSRTTASADRLVVALTGKGGAK
jgi:hypothetical protein